MTSALQSHVLRTVRAYYLLNFIQMFARTTLRRAFAAPRRSYASVSSGSVNPGSVGPFQVFDRNAKMIQKDRSAEREDGSRSRTVDYVREEVADRMMERLLVRVQPVLRAIANGHVQDIKRKFNTILDLGSGPGHLSKMLEPYTTQKVVMLDSSSMLFLQWRLQILSAHYREAAGARSGQRL